MKQVYLILLVACVFAAAMVPRERRAVNTEEQALSSTSPSSTSTGVKTICAARTPCGWSIYRPVIKFIEFNITNQYCNCGPGLVCAIDEDDTTVSSYVHHCKLPSEVDPDFS